MSKVFNVAQARPFGPQRSKRMYIAINRFKVIKGHEEEFERRWLGPGYLSRS